MPDNLAADDRAILARLLRRGVRGRINPSIRLRVAEERVEPENHPDRRQRAPNP
jgi:hypothetical protein